MSWTGLENLNDNPENLVIPSKYSKIEEKQEFVKKEIGSFVEQYVLSEFDVEKARRKEIEKMKENENTERQSIGETALAGQQNFNTGTVYLIL